MDELLIRISQLPQVLQNIIGMYNVTHRQMMKLVCRELELVQRKCEYCNEYIDRQDIITDFVIYRNFNYCSEYCSYNHGYEFRRDYWGLQLVT